MREQFRPFCLTTRTTATPDGVDVTLSGTNGDSVSCNYITVTCDGAVNHFYSVCPVGISGGLSADDQLHASAIGATGSSTSPLRGAMASTDGGVVSLSLSPNDAVSQIRITATGGTNRYFVQYGNVSISNAIKDNNRGTGT